MNSSSRDINSSSGSSGLSKRNGRLVQSSENSNTNNSSQRRGSNHSLRSTGSNNSSTSCGSNHRGSKNTSTQSIPPPPIIITQFPTFRHSSQTTTWILGSESITTSHVLPNNNSSQHSHNSSNSKHMNGDSSSVNGGGESVGSLDPITPSSAGLSSMYHLFSAD